MGRGSRTTLAKAPVPKAISLRSGGRSLPLRLHSQFGAGRSAIGSVEPVVMTCHRRSSSNRPGCVIARSSRLEKLTIKSPNPVGRYLLEFYWAQLIPVIVSMKLGIDRYGAPL